MDQVVWDAYMVFLKLQSKYEIRSGDVWVVDGKSCWDYPPGPFRICNERLEVAFREWLVR
jgi:hypothetical protein